MHTHTYVRRSAYRIQHIASAPSPTTAIHTHWRCAYESIQAHTNDRPNEQNNTNTSDANEICASPRQAIRISAWSMARAVRVRGGEFLWWELAWCVVLNINVDSHATHSNQHEHVENQVWHVLSTSYTLLFVCLCIFFAQLGCLPAVAFLNRLDVVWKCCILRVCLCFILSLTFCVIFLKFFACLFYF